MNDHQDSNPIASAQVMFLVLLPFKVQGAVVKPPQWVTMTPEEARPYQEAGALGTEPREVQPEPNTETSDDSGSAEGAAGGEGSAGGQADTSTAAQSDQSGAVAGDGQADAAAMTVATVVSTLAPGALADALKTSDAAKAAIVNPPAEGRGGRKSKKAR